MRDFRAQRFLVAAAWLLFGLGLSFAWWGWNTATPPVRSGFLLSADGEAACVIVLPERPTTEQRAAADLLAETLAAATGAPGAHFRVVSRAADHPSRSRSIRLVPAPPRAGAPDPLRRGVGYAVTSRHVDIFADWPEDIGLAASWFLEREVGARWFMPGELGREVDPRRTRQLAPGEHRGEPGYFSRNLGGMHSSAEKAWFQRNRLKPLFQHSHTADKIITPEAATQDPRLAPEINGRRYAPPPGSSAWQPDLTSPATVELATAYFRRELRDDPRKVTANFGQNDSWGWDQSAATLAQVAPHRHFRNYPDYSNTLFAFLNAVAERLAPEFPDRFLTTYAYQWTENTPRFPVHPMVLPYLTADRSQWFDPDYAAEDQDLMRRWGQAGPRHFALYDYYYGAPFYVPRPTLYAVTRPIPYAHSVGARGFYAECLPNWGLDGPKLWLAAQLLWNPAAEPAALLDDYYARYWREAAGPMRAFFELCEARYLQQPKPAYWLRYFRDEHQRLLFPPEVRAQLRDQLRAAAASARTPRVRERVDLVSRAFALAELFCAHDETRAELMRVLMEADRRTTPQVREALANYEDARAAFLNGRTQIKRELPLAVRGEPMVEYLREDPRSRALLELSRRGETAVLSREAVETLFAGSAPSPSEWRKDGRDLLIDPGWLALRRREAHPFTLLDWLEAGQSWLGKSEPFATLRREFVPQPDGTNALRYTGANQEGFYQAHWAKAGTLYHLAVRVKAKVSPGNMTYLLAVFADENNKPVGPGTTQRLPAGDWSEGVTLEFLVRAPQGAKIISFALRTLWQVNDDFAEWSSPRLREIEP